MHTDLQKMLIKRVVINVTKHIYNSFRSKCGNAVPVGAHRLNYALIIRSQTKLCDSHPAIPLVGPDYGGSASVKLQRR